MKDTAVEWLVKEFKDTILREYSELRFEEIVKQAKEMERQQILDAVDWGNRKGYDEHILTIVYDLDEQYYNQTFKSK